MDYLNNSIRAITRYISENGPQTFRGIVEKMRGGDIAENDIRGGIHIGIMCGYLNEEYTKDHPSGIISVGEKQFVEDTHE